MLSVIFYWSGTMARRISSTLLAGVFLTVMVSAKPVMARPEYSKEFWKLYQKELGNQAKKKCTVCHDVPNKSLRNNYGEAFGSKFGTMPIKDAKRIIEALRATENDLSDISGLTFGDLINMGKLPASK